MGEVAERLWELFGPYLEAEDVELDDVEIKGVGKGRVLRVSLDAEGGISVDRIADLARGLSRILDEADPIPGPYSLEATSPGLERNLRRPAHYRKSVGREAIVKTVEPVAKAHSHRGMLERVDDDGFVLRIGDTARRIEFGEVASARTVFTWERGVKPGRPAGGVS